MAMRVDDSTTPLTLTVSMVVNLCRTGRLYGEPVNRSYREVYDNFRQPHLAIERLSVEMFV